MDLLNDKNIITYLPYIYSPKDYLVNQYAKPKSNFLIHTFYKVKNIDLDIDIDIYTYTYVY